MRSGLTACLLLVLAAGLARGDEGEAARLNREGNRLYQEGKVDEALSRYAEALALAPSSSPLHYNLGNALYRAERFQEALDAYAAAVANQEALSALGRAARFNEGTASLQAEDYENAVRSLREAVGADPTDLDARRNLELALARLQQEQQEQEQQKQQQGEEGKEGEEQQGENESSPEQQDEEPGEKEDGGQRQGPQEQDPGGETPPRPQGEEQQGEPQEPEGSEPLPAEASEDLSEEEARRLLAALARDERQDLKESLEKPRKKSAGGGRDW